MKALILAILSLCFALSVVALSTQDAPDQAPQKTQAATGTRLTTIMGTIEKDGDKLRFVSDTRAWNVDNPEILKSHEGHYVHAKAYVYADKDSIHITEVKMPTPSETKKDDLK